jgi:hypothetical protein
VRPKFFVEGRQAGSFSLFYEDSTPDKACRFRALSGLFDFQCISIAWFSLLDLDFLTVSLEAPRVRCFQL